MKKRVDSCVFAIAILSAVLVAGCGDCGGGSGDPDGPPVIDGTTVIDGTPCVSETGA